LPRIKPNATLNSLWPTLQKREENNTVILGFALFLILES
jgi:hypothetical protein